MKSEAIADLNPVVKIFRVHTTSQPTIDMSKPLPGRIKELPDYQYQLEKYRIVKASEAKIRFLQIGFYTICYRVDRRSVIELSTAICHPSDKFNKHKGRVFALQNFTDKRRILLKNTSGLPAHIFLENIFGFLL